MRLLNQVTANPSQMQRVILSDGSTFTITIVFKPMQLGWFISDLTYGDFNLKGVRIVTSPNILYQYKNVLPFGIACYTSENREPQLQQDFSSGNSKLYLLDEDDVAEIAELFSGQT